ncbi:hypothetical protein E4U43_005213, partial [Claviceps pusilla]
SVPDLLTRRPGSALEVPWKCPGSALADAPGRRRGSHGQCWSVPAGQCLLVSACWSVPKPM